VEDESLRFRAAATVTLLGHETGLREKGKGLPNSRERQSGWHQLEKRSIPGDASNCDHGRN
jgi:hypothetical protein